MRSENEKDMNKFEQAAGVVDKFRQGKVPCLSNKAVSTTTAGKWSPSVKYGTARHLTVELLSAFYGMILADVRFSSDKVDYCIFTYIFGTTPMKRLRHFVLTLCMG